jgi:hypothetical protein
VGAAGTSPKPVEARGAQLTCVWRRTGEERGGGWCHVGQSEKWGPADGARERRPAAGPAAGLSWAGWCKPRTMNNVPLYLLILFKLT